MYEVTTTAKKNQNTDQIGTVRLVINPRNIAANTSMITSLEILLLLCHFQIILFLETNNHPTISFLENPIRRSSGLTLILNPRKVQCRRQRLIAQNAIGEIFADPTALKTFIDRLFGA